MDRLLRRIDDLNKSTEGKLDKEKTDQIIAAMDSMIAEATSFLREVENSDIFGTGALTVRNDAAESIVTMDFNRKPAQPPLRSDELPKRGETAQKSDEASPDDDLSHKKYD